MYKLDNFSLTILEKDNLVHLVRWANLELFHSIISQKHYINLKNAEGILQSLASQILLISMNQEPIGFCEIYNVDYQHRHCWCNIYIDNFDHNFILHGYKILGMVNSYIFKIMGMNKISVDIPLEDAMTIAVYKQRDYETELNKRAHLYKNFTYHAVAEMSLLLEQYLNERI